MHMCTVMCLLLTLASPLAFPLLQGGLKHLFGAFMGKAKIRGPHGAIRKMGEGYWSGWRYDQGYSSECPVPACYHFPHHCVQSCASALYFSQLCQPILIPTNCQMYPVGEHDVEIEVEERCVSLIASLFTQLGPRGGRRERLGAKFVEAEYEKTDRLMELFFRFVSVPV